MPLNSYLFQTSLCFKENNPFVSSKYRGLTTDLNEPNKMLKQRLLLGVIILIPGKFGHC